MRDFVLNFGELAEQPPRLATSAQTLNNVGQRLSAQASRLSGQQGFGIQQIRNIVSGLQGDFARLSSDVDRLSNYLRMVHNTAAEAESQAYQALGGDAANGPLPMLRIPPKFGPGSNWREWIRWPGGSPPWEWPTPFPPFSLGPWMPLPTVPWSPLPWIGGVPPIMPMPWLVSSLITIGGGIVGSAVGSTVSALFPKGSVGTSVWSASGQQNIGNNSSASWGASALNASAGTSSTSSSVTAQANASLLSGNASFQSGSFNAGVNAHVGHVYARAGANASIGPTTTVKWCNDTNKWKETTTLISAGVTAAAGVQLLGASANMSAGSSNLGVNASAQGGILGAGASGSANFSVTADGNVNAYATGRAMAYVASGSVRGTFNLGPFSFGASASGYAGAAGVSGTVGIQNGRFTIGGSAALGVGGGGQFSVGLNPAFIQSAGAQVQQVTNFVGNTASTVGNAVGNVTSTVTTGIGNAAGNVVSGVRNLFGR